MNFFYQLTGTSRQAHHQYRQRCLHQSDKTAYYLSLMEEARAMHPIIGLAKIYALYQPEGIGRSAFEALGALYGYVQERKPRLSFQQPGALVYPNLLQGKELTGVNQGWATDITYYKIKQEYYYISMILDLYSRKIVAHGLARSLEAKHSLRVLRQAVRNNGISKNNELVHHSDKGTQYTSHAYTAFLKKKGIGISMCRSVYENTHMERLNGIIKNDYLIHWYPQSFSQLHRLLNRAVENYNNCPHGSLAMQTPIQFEQNLPNIPLEKRSKMKIFTFKTTKNLTDPNQLGLFKEQLIF